jgi:hypothetical protein
MKNPVLKGSEKFKITEHYVALCSTTDNLASIVLTNERYISEHMEIYLLVMNQPTKEFLSPPSPKHK